MESKTMKTCTGCWITKSTAEFYTVRGKPHGRCKTCVLSENAKRWRQAHPEVKKRSRIKQIDGTRECTECHLDQPISEYRLQYETPVYRCKTCMNKAAKIKRATSGPALARSQRLLQEEQTGMRVCTECATQQPLADFRPVRGVPGRRCKTCMNTADRLWKRGRSVIQKRLEQERLTGNRECTGCGATKPMTLYYKERTGHARRCKECIRADSSHARRTSRRINPQGASEKQRAATLKHAYNLTTAEYTTLTSNQGGVCAICGEPPLGASKRLVIDHDHTTGKVRGLLCNNCNGGIGLLGDDHESLASAIAYLNATREEAAS